MDKRILDLCIKYVEFRRATYNKDIAIKDIANFDVIDVLFSSKYKLTKLLLLSDESEKMHDNDEKLYKEISELLQDKLIKYKYLRFVKALSNENYEECERIRKSLDVNIIGKIWNIFCRYISITLKKQFI